jgi:hypothetical protein
MATRKKKNEAQTPTQTWPKVEKGSHLTVTTYENGRTELEWDDEALARDVREAIQSHEATELVGALVLGGRPTTRARK